MTAINHSGVAAEISILPVLPAAGPGLVTFELSRLSSLHPALDRVYKLSISLPDAPLTRFRIKTKDLPRSTEAERLVVHLSRQAFERLRRLGHRTSVRVEMDSYLLRCMSP
jgi:hypothetical protein